MTDAVKEWYQRKPGDITCPMGVMTGRVADGVYLALWVPTAKQNESKLGCDRHEQRNHLREAQLAILDRAEDRVTEFIDLDNIKPINAVKAAGIRSATIPSSSPHNTQKANPAVKKTAGFLLIFQNQNYNNLYR